jgi:CHAT domain-containing protein
MAFPERLRFTRAFLCAGASSVVVSLWKVEDQSTSMLMEKFYGYLKRGETKASALRKAKIDIINSRVNIKATSMTTSLASPFFWAPFIIFGN